MLIDSLIPKAQSLAGNAMAASVWQAVRRVVPAWGVVVAANLLALLLTLLLTPYIEPSPFPLFAIAIAVSVKYAGAPGGVVSVLYAT